MVHQRIRQLFKHTLSLAGIKLLYARITLTRYTAFYFVLSLASCISLVSMQALTLADNTQAVELLESVFAQSQKIVGLPIITDGVLGICADIPDRSTNCTSMAYFNGVTPLTEGSGEISVQKRALIDADFLFARDSASEGPSQEGDTQMGLSLGLSDSCVASLTWLNDVLHDAQREDVVTLFFQIWLFVLCFITILNESIPHLGAGFLGHVLGTAWAAYRLRSTFMMRSLYRTQIVPGACGGIDLVGNWWEIRISHAVPIIVFNVLTLAGTGFVSYKLFQVYANQSFCRVGASERVYRIYKIVLLFSVCMQLSGFFSIASTAMWIDKVCHGLLHSLAKHSNVYLAAFITTLVLHVPWLYFGWICVRRECRIRFGVFCGISAFLTTTSTLVFFSPLYRYIFLTWPFFATVTVTAYCLVIASTMLGVVCQFNFGQGLAHYLLVTEALEGVDFTPVNFTTKANSSDLEKSDIMNDAKELSPHDIDDIPNFPVSSWPTPSGGGTRRPSGKKQRGASVYSEKNGDPIILSFSPPLVSELGPAPNRFSKASSVSRYSAYTSKRATRRETVVGFSQRNTIVEDVQFDVPLGGGGDGGDEANPTTTTTTTNKPLPTITHINTDVRHSRLKTTSPIFDTPSTMRSSNRISSGAVSTVSAGGANNANATGGAGGAGISATVTPTAGPGPPKNRRIGSPNRLTGTTGVVVGLPASPRSRPLGERI